MASVEILEEEEIFEDAEVDVDGFDEVEIEVDLLDDGEIAPEAEGEDGVVLVDLEAVAEGEDDIDEDSEADLAEVLASTIYKASVGAKTKAVARDEDGDELIIEALPTPKQADEFRCTSCRLLKKNTQLADKEKVLCRDCV